MSLFVGALRGRTNFLTQGRLHGAKGFLGLIGRGGCRVRWGSFSRAHGTLLWKKGEVFLTSFYP